MVAEQIGVFQNEFLTNARPLASCVAEGFTFLLIYLYKNFGFVQGFVFRVRVGVVRVRGGSAGGGISWGAGCGLDRGFTG